MTQPTRADARNRALRTLGQGLLTDVFAAVALFGQSYDGGMSPRAAGALFATCLIKTAAMAAASYTGRFISPPASAAGDHVAP